MSNVLRNEYCVSLGMNPVEVEVPAAGVGVAGTAAVALEYEGGDQMSAPELLLS